METFGTDHVTTSMVASTQMGLIHVTGPISAYLLEHFSCRCIAIIGSIFAACGLMISSIVANLVSLYLTAGLVTGNFYTFMVGFLSISFIPRYWIWSHVPTHYCYCNKVL